MKAGRAADEKNAISRSFGGGRLAPPVAVRQGPSQELPK
jgi:hypothetical protein